MSLTMEKLSSLCKKRGFISQSGKLYGGLNGCWDYGHLGVELKQNIKNYWWKKHIRQTDKFHIEQDDLMLGFDGSILTHQKVLKASGHTENFNDIMRDCKDCKARFRVDESKSCPKCKSDNLSEPKAFNLMFKTQVGAIQNEENSEFSYLRPETAQSIFSAYGQIFGTGNIKLPFGVGQIGKAFRNEINPRHYIFRSREFEQMEIEYFCHPEESDEILDKMRDSRLRFYEEIGIPKEKLHILDVPEKERAHYSKKTYDIEYDFPFGRKELEGIAHRGDYDLKQHSLASGKNLEYFDEKTGWKGLPHIIEPSAGVDRILLALLCEAYREEKIENNEKEEIRTYLAFNPKIAPIKIACLPLLKKNANQCEIAKKICQELREKNISSAYYENGAIGKRYRRSDEIGIPYCLTIDFETLGEGENPKDKDTITLRHRDTMKQERIPIEKIGEKILSLIT